MHFWQSFIDSKIIKHNFEIKKYSDNKKMNMKWALRYSELWKRDKEIIFWCVFGTHQIWCVWKWNKFYFFSFLQTFLAHTKFYFYDHAESHNTWVLIFSWFLDDLWENKTPKTEKILAIISRKTSWISLIKFISWQNYQEIKYK